MDKISTRFFFSNLLTALFIVVSIPWLKQENELLFDGEDSCYGVVVLFAFISGTYFSIVRAKFMGQNLFRRMSRFEKVFIGILYFFSLMANMTMVLFSLTLINGTEETIPQYAFIILVCLMLFNLWCLGLEVTSLSKPQGKPVSDKKNKKAEWFRLLYVSAGAAATWDNMIISQNFSLSWDQHDFWSELIATIVLVIMILIPFQRLFWYEIMVKSKGWKENLKVFAAFSTALVAAIAPLFFI